MKWSSVKFQYQLSNKGLTYDELADLLMNMGWVCIKDFIVLQLHGFAGGIAPARFRDCTDIAEAMGLHVHSLLEDDTSPCFSDEPAMPRRMRLDPQRLSA